MNNVLRLILSLSVSGTMLFLITFFGSLLLKERFGKTWYYYLWLVVIFRFLLPITTENSPVGNLFQAIPAYQAGTSAVVEKVAVANIDIVNGEQNKAQQDNNTAHTKTSAQEVFYTMDKYLLLLLITEGLFLLIRKITLYQSFVAYMKAGNREVSDPVLLNCLGCVCEELGIRRQIELYENPLVDSPFIYGFFKPTIVLNTTNVSPSIFRFIMLHELIHYRRGDMFYKWLVQITLCLHWFNPIVYWLAKEVNVACELSCDEAVIKKLDVASKKAYGDVLIETIKSSGKYRQSLAGITLSENAKTVKTRLKSIMNYKKKRKSIIIVSVLLLVILGIGGIFIGAASINNKNIRDNTASHNISLKGKSDAYKLLAQMYEVDPSLPIAEYKKEILKLCGGDEGKLFEAISEAEIDDPGDSLYTFVWGSLSYTSSEMYADLKINPDDEPFVRVSVERIVYQSEEELNEQRGDMSDEEWDLFLKDVKNELPFLDRSLFVDYLILFHIPDKTAITVGERDAVFMTIISEIQKYIDGLSEEAIFADTFNSSFEAKLEKVTAENTSDKMFLQFEVGNIEKFILNK